MNSSKYPFLSRVNSPSDVKNMSDSELDALCAEIREFLIDSVTKTGGHLASNLGVVELTLAIHRVFDSPRDKIVWDVGHQSYVHKLLTGRGDRFDTLRAPGGLSGFTKREESEHDPFGAGHSSTSVSAALGIAEAARLAGDDSYTIAVLGDGAFTGGMVHEALNNCSERKGLKLIVIINENEMSISKNIGRLAKSISKIRTRPEYFRAKDATRGILCRIPLIGKPLVKLMVCLKKRLKNALYDSNYFENLGLYYIGPIDGNDRKSVEAMLSEAKKCNESVILHVKTVKGKGYAPAEETPDKYHSIPSKYADPAGGFSSAFGDELCALAANNEKICAITAAMSRGTGLSRFESEFSDRFFDVGIAEEHAVTFAAGLAAGGARPVCAIYSTFLQRAYDNVIHDVALQKLPVVFCVDRAGINISDGATHNGIYDVAFLSEIPNVKIYTPATYAALRAALAEALRAAEPAAVRYPNDVEDAAITDAFYKDRAPDVAGVRTSGLTSETRCAVVVHGRMATTALKAKELLGRRGIECAVFLCEYAAPYDKLASELLDASNGKIRNVVFLEEEIRRGGFGMNLSDALARRGAFTHARYTILASDDGFAAANGKESVYASQKIDADSVVLAMEDMLRDEA